MEFIHFDWSNMSYYLAWRCILFNCFEMQESLNFLLLYSSNKITLPSKGKFFHSSIRLAFRSVYKHFPDLLVNKRVYILWNMTLARSHVAYCIVYRKSSYFIALFFAILATSRCISIGNIAWKNETAHAHFRTGNI